MKRKILETGKFSKEVDRLISNHKLLKLDFENFKKDLAENPQKGDLVVGTGGIRKK